MPQNLSYTVTEAVVTTWIVSNNGGSNATIGAGGTIMLASAASGAVDITLPPAADNEDRVVVVKKTDSSVNAVTVVPDGADTIDGAANFILSVQYQSVTLASNGASWYVI